ncbi:hypothetical protein F2Q69_00013075 [Brassica cretica]|uniref:Uncharacterized protein n=1 Tax=Brassica cretica TaxID=69181 RepID=A0A8S9QVW2_BRACR|nr:hypothetical protein F2Q69_00013075 [Brassica cretica]
MSASSSTTSGRRRVRTPGIPIGDALAQTVKNLEYATAVMVIPLRFRDQLAFIGLAMLLLIWLNGYIYMKFMGVLSVRMYKKSSQVAMRRCNANGKATLDYPFRVFLAFTMEAIALSHSTSLSP